MADGGCQMADGDGSAVVPCGKLEFANCQDHEMALLE